MSTTNARTGNANDAGARAELDCAADLRRAVAHIEAGTGTMGLTLLSKYRDCHANHPSCAYRGDDCAIPELLSGFRADGGEGTGG